MVEVDDYEDREFARKMQELKKQLTPEIVNEKIVPKL